MPGAVCHDAVEFLHYATRHGTDGVEPHYRDRGRSAGRFDCRDQMDDMPSGTDLKVAIGACAYPRRQAAEDAPFKADGVTPTEIASRLRIGRAGVYRVLGKQLAGDRVPAC
jgi:hypothetical protein